MADLEQRIKALEEQVAITKQQLKSVENDQNDQDAMYKYAMNLCSILITRVTKLESSWGRSGLWGPQTLKTLQSDIEKLQTQMTRLERPGPRRFWFGIEK